MAIHVVSNTPSGKCEWQKSKKSANTKDIKPDRCFRAVASTRRKGPKGRSLLMPDASLETVASQYITMRFAITYVSSGISLLPLSCLKSYSSLF
jgi:hypothetical protein